MSAIPGIGSVLIANRGEIAVRIARTLRALRIRSIVAHHRVDRDGPARRAADAGVELEADDPLEAYLDGEQIAVAAARSRSRRRARCSRAGAEALALPANIREPAEVDRLFARIAQAWGGLDALVNNAGGQFPQHALDISDKGWRAVIDTNLNGTWTMMQRAARQWRERGGPGCIVDILAPYLRGMHGVAHTVAARAGVAHLVRAVALEWARSGSA